jgi:hypothetical protein
MKKKHHPLAFMKLALQLVTHFKFGVSTSMDGWYMTWMQITFFKSKIHLLRKTFCFFSFSFVSLTFIKCTLCLCDDFPLMGWVFVFELWWGYWVPYCKVAMLIPYNLGVMYSQYWLQSNVDKYFNKHLKII